MTAQVQPIRPAAHALPVCIVGLREVYGNTTVYPVGIVAQTFADVAGTKTLTANTLRCIKKLGYRIAIESGGEGRGYEFLNSMIGY
jgi:hypothetical protein